MAKGILKKPQTKLKEQKIYYSLPLGDEVLNLNERLGQKITFTWTQKVQCIYCQRPIKKTYNQGYCYPCFLNLPQCDLCIVKPELCHFEQGTCRDSNWGEQHCIIPHTVYLSYASGVKVGITRAYQKEQRWIDQGAIYALEIGKVSSRLLSGRVEVAFKKQVADKTNWRKMLQKPQEKVDLLQRWKELQYLWPKEIPNLLSKLEAPLEFQYPVLQYPLKIVSHNLEKEASFSSVLQGIKGTYLIFSDRVINLRKYAGYEVEIN